MGPPRTLAVAAIVVAAGTLLAVARVPAPPRPWRMPDIARCRDVTGTVSAPGVGWRPLPEVPRRHYDAGRCAHLYWGPHSQTYGTRCEGRLGPLRAVNDSISEHWQEFGREFAGTVNTVTLRGVTVDDHRIDFDCHLLWSMTSTDLSNPRIRDDAADLLYVYDPARRLFGYRCVHHADPRAPRQFHEPDRMLLLQEVPTPGERLTGRLNRAGLPTARVVAAALVLSAMFVLGRHLRRDRSGLPWREAVRGDDGALRVDDGRLVVVSSANPAVPTARVLCVVTAPRESGAPFRDDGSLYATHAWVGSLDALARTFQRRERWTMATVVVLAMGATVVALASLR